METKANYVLVGAFTLLVIAIAFGYIFWAASQDDSTPQSVYGINFQGSVSGLSVTAPVLLNGVRVGQVTNIRLSPDDVSAVYVTISVAKGTPIKEDSVATLEAQGLTGTSRVMISGGTNNSPLLTAKENGKAPVIKSETAGLQAIMLTMPQVLATAHVTLRHLDRFFTEENSQAVAGILSGLNNMVTRLNTRMDNIEKTITHLEASAREINGLVNDLRPAGKDIAMAMHSFQNTMSHIDRVATAATPALEKLSRDGIDDFRRLMVDARMMVNAVTRLTEKLENDPRRFLFGQTLPEYNGQ